MSIDTRREGPAANPTATVRELVDAAGLLVAGLGLSDGDRWTAASPGVAATAATLRSAVRDLSRKTRPLDENEPIDALPVTVGAPPVVRAREIGFLASRLVALLDVSDGQEIHATMTSVGSRLKEDLRMLREAPDLAVSRPRRSSARPLLRRRIAPLPERR